MSLHLLLQFLSHGVIFSSSFPLKDHQQTTFINVSCSTYRFHIFLLHHGDIETNSVPSKEKLKNLSCCHWNINSLITRNLFKISLLEAYNAI